MPILLSNPGSEYQAILASPEDSRILKILTENGVSNLQSEINKIQKLQNTILSLNEVLSLMSPSKINRVAVMRDTLLTAENELSQLAEKERTIARQVLGLFSAKETFEASFG